jgi:hypothetical protein
MTLAEMKAIALANPWRTLTILFLASRAVLLALGCRFDFDNLTSSMQIADIGLLHDDMWRTLWYTHSVPPLFDFLVGCGVKLGLTLFPWYFLLLYAAVTLGGILALQGLVRAVTGRDDIALLTGAWACISPAVILFSFKLYYDSLVPWMVSMALWGLHQGMTRQSTRHFLFGFSMFALTMLVRTMFHPITFAIILVVYLAFAKGQRWRVLATAAGPAAVVGLFMLKNLLIFGFFGLSSWAPLYPNHTTVDRLPHALRQAMVDSGKLSRFGMIDGFGYPAENLALLPPAPPTGQPVLDNLSKSTGEPNFNNILYVRVGPYRAKDPMVAIKADPKDFAILLVTSFYHFNRPASEFKGLESNLAHISVWERLTNATIGLQPVAWFGGTLDPARPINPWLQISYSTLLMTMVFAGAAARMALIGIRRLRTRTLPTPVECLIAIVVMIGWLLILVSCSFDVWENNRAHFSLSTILWIGTLWFVFSTRPRTSTGSARA